MPSTFASEEEHTPTELREDAAKARRQRWLFLGGGCLLGTAAVGTIAVGGASTPEEAIQFGVVAAGGYVGGPTLFVLRTLKANRLEAEAEALEAAP